VNKPLKSVTHGQCDARPTVTFLAAGLIKSLRHPSAEVADGQLLPVMNTQVAAKRVDRVHHIHAHLHRVHLVLLGHQDTPAYKDVGTSPTDSTAHQNIINFHDTSY